MPAWPSAEPGPPAARDGRHPPATGPSGRPGSPVPGVAVVVALAALAWGAATATGLSPLALGVVAGVVAGNVRGVPAAARPGVEFVARLFLRSAIVLMGLRLSLGDLRGLGGAGVAAVVAGAAATFVGVRWLARRLGVSGDLGLLVAAGYAVCGASAIAAVNGVRGADDDDVAFAVGLVTLFGTLSIVVLPALAGAAGLGPVRTGAWAGAAVHDVGQVVAAASGAGPSGLTTAVVVKLCRVMLLAPLVAGLGAADARRRSVDRAGIGGSSPGGATGRAPGMVPGFVVAFIGAVAVRSTGVVPEAAVTTARSVEVALFCTAMVALGTGVRLGRVRATGWRPIALGLAAWLLVGGLALGVAQVVGRSGGFTP